MDEIKNTLLYKKLKLKDKKLAFKVLENSNEIVELINKKTTINFPNYTNHDVRHSVNIIDTIYELIKDKIKEFNALELGMMIYSAMYHDIGMALDDEEIKKIKSGESKYLYGKDFESIKSSNGDDENLALQEIIRVSHGKIANDLITTKYKEHFKLPDTHIYFDEDLGKICEAHTLDKSYVEDLKEHRTKGEYEYNARFIAILLRVADILDIGATRTPLELYNVMDLNSYSDDEWHKNFSIDNTKKIYKKNKLKEIRLEGSCQNIKVHRKLLEYIKWIENELKLATDLTSNMKEKYHLELNTQVKNSIEPKGYSIPDLKLNMDYHAVTNLLMGESIYGSKDMGLRELIQNSIDACMIKKEKLDKDNPDNNYMPTIDINIDEENNQVIIEDNGMGMNENIIKNYFLNVGKSYYKSKDFLDYKHEYSPIGNFGIGFLSCFMLSPEVKVITKYFGESRKYEIDLEQNSEYISFKEEDESIWESGSKIILSLESFKKAISKTDSLENDINKFLNNHILINEYIININKQKIEQKKEKKESDFEIDLSEYFENIDGYILLNKKETSNQIEEDFINSKSSYYFNGENFIKLSSFDELKFDNIYLPWSEIMYYRVPLLDENKSGEIKRVLNITSEYNFYESLKDHDFICIFISNKYEIPFFEEFNIFNKIGKLEDFTYLDRDNHAEYITTPSIDLIKENNCPIYFVKKFEFIYNDSGLLPLKSNLIRSSTYNRKSLYIKNIVFNCNLTFKLLKMIQIKDTFINIKDENIILNISRSKVIKESETLLSNALGEIIIKFILENFSLTAEEKILVQKFIDEYYPEKSILLK